MAKPFAVDTNVLIYLHDNSAQEKRAIAKGLLADTPKIPSQVISEYINTCRRLLKLDKSPLSVTLIKSLEYLDNPVDKH